MGAATVGLLLMALLFAPPPVGGRKARKERRAKPPERGSADHAMPHETPHEHALATAAVTEWVEGMIRANGTSPEVLRAAMRQVVGDAAPQAPTAAARAYGLPSHAHSPHEDVSRRRPAGTRNFPAR